MDDLIQVKDQFYILATASRASERTAVLQRDDTFAVFDLRGDIGAFGRGEQGLYHAGMRHLSLLHLRLNGLRPLLLSARVNDDNERFGSDLTNPDIPLDDPGHVLQRDIVHLFRARFLWRRVWHERVRLSNYGRAALRLTLSFLVDADFHDIFEVRGATRLRRGTRLAPVLDGGNLRLGYLGRDSIERRTIVEWSDRPASVSLESPVSVRFEYELPPNAQTALSFGITCESGPRQATVPVSFDAAQAELDAEIGRARRDDAAIETSSERFNEWVRRSAADLHMLSSATPFGRYPYAGVPWFATPFGRDGLITALQTLWINPVIARDVLAYLANTQATDDRPEQDANPGKILHEAREGEMAALGEVPFARYYGSVDATPLFVVLACAYFDRTDDRAFVETLLPPIERALRWIEQYGDLDGDGFIEYGRRAPGGLLHQGWKDSIDAVFHDDGTLAEGPIALAEVQAYVYAAYAGAARLLEALRPGSARARTLNRRASELRDAFEQRFWCEDLATYALALDGAKRPCRVRTSNAGHCLFGGIVGPERAERLARQLVGPDMFSGWGIRTVSTEEKRYNPMSYHNGSVWPHDNGIIAAGLSRYGFDDLIVSPFRGLFEASAAVDNHRLPELFCGFHRRVGEGPTLYPVACSPQAWAAGVVFHLIQSCLRLSLDLPGRRLLIARPMLPPFLDRLRLSRLSLPFGMVDLSFERRKGETRVSDVHRTGRFEVAVVASPAEVAGQA